jgi:hypothetical protein
MSNQVDIVLNAVDKASKTVDGVNKSLGGTDKAAKGAGLSFGNLSSIVGKVAPWASVGTAILSVGTYLGQASKAAAMNAEVMAKQEAIIRATGGSAGFTSEQLVRMADEMERLTHVDGDLISQSQSLLHTFRNISNDEFPRAIKAAIDLQTTFGGLEESTKGLGMAANDFDGYTRLQRSGVTFSEEQKKQIKLFEETNDLLGYQNLLFDEIEKQVGGTAAAIAAAGDGSANLTNATGALSEAIGRQVLPATREWNRVLAELTWALAEATDAEAEYYDIKRQAIAAIRESNGEVEQGAISFGKHGRSVRESGEEIRYHTAMIERQNSYLALTEEQLKTLGVQFYETNQAVAENAEVTEAASKANQDLLRLTDSITQNTQSHAEKQADLTAKMEENRAEAEKLYPWQAGELEKLNEQYAEMGAQYATNADQHKAASDRILYDLLLQKLSVDGLTTAEYEMALAYGQSVGIFDEASAKMALAMDSVTNAVNDGRLKVEDMKAALELMAAGNYDVDMAIRITETVKRGYDMQMLAAGPGFANGTGGQWMTVPPGYSNDSYPVRLQSGEEFAVRSRSEVTQGGGQSGTVELSFATVEAIGQAVGQAMARAGMIQ